MYCINSGVYYATVMVLTTAATVTGVIILRVHHKGREGVSVPLYLRKIAQSVFLKKYELATLLYLIFQNFGNINIQLISSN